MRATATQVDAILCFFKRKLIVLNMTSNSLQQQSIKIAYVAYVH